MLKKQLHIKIDSITLVKILVSITAILVIFFFFEEKIKSNNIYPENINPYQKLNNRQYLTGQLGNYGKIVVIEIGDRVFINRHPANSPEFFGQVYQHFPNKQNQEIRILFLGNSQLFQIGKEDPYPVPFRTEQLLREKMDNQNIRVLNLSCFGMNTSEILLTAIKAIKQLEADFVVLAISPRDLVNEETKTMGIAPPYSTSILELSTIQELFKKHFQLLGKNSLSLILESFTQYSRVWQREINQNINNFFANLWHTYNNRNVLKLNIAGILTRQSHISSSISQTEASLVKSPSLDNPLYAKEPYPNTRSIQFLVLLDLLKENFPDTTLVYNEPLRPKTLNLYFTPEDYADKIKFFKNSCQKNGLSFVDLNGLLNNEYFEDWVHLNPKGVNKLSEILTELIQQKLIVNLSQNGF